MKGKSSCKQNLKNLKFDLKNWREQKKKQRNPRRRLKNYTNKHGKVTPFSSRTIHYLIIIFIIIFIAFFFLFKKIKIKI